MITGLVYLTGGSAAGRLHAALPDLGALRQRAALRGAGPGAGRAGDPLLRALFWAGPYGAHPPARHVRLPGLPPKPLLYSIFVTAVACATVALIGSYLSESLRQAGEQLEEAAEQVADLRELHELIVNSIHSGLVTADAGGHVLYVNAFGEQMLGLRAAQRPRPPARGGVRVPAAGAAALQARAATIALARLELVYRAPDGRELDLGLSVSPLATARAARAASCSSSRTSPRIKQLEREVRIKEKLAAVGEMAAQLAHEIRNPLGSISGSAQVLLSEPGISGEQEQLLAIITRESQAALRQPEPVPGPGAGGTRRARRAGGPAAGGRRRRSRCCATAPEVGPGPRGGARGRRGTATSAWPTATRSRRCSGTWRATAWRPCPRAACCACSSCGSGDDVVLSVRDQGRGMDREEQRRHLRALPLRQAHRHRPGAGHRLPHRPRAPRRHHRAQRAPPGDRGAGAAAPGLRRCQAA